MITLNDSDWLVWKSIYSRFLGMFLFSKNGCAGWLTRCRIKHDFFSRDMTYLQVIMYKYLALTCTPSLKLL